MDRCILCPRECGADRALGKTGWCGSGAHIRAARAALLYYEEPCICPEAGSGAVFFTGCSLGCVFCQNIEIASGRKGNEGLAVTPERLCEIFFSLQDQGAANINLVTGGHFIHEIIPSLKLAKERGLRIPVVYNTSSYERPEIIRALEGLVDIWLPDLKFCSPELSLRYCRAADYFDRAFAAIREMVRQCPEPVFDSGEDSLMKSGVIVRHMVMPGHTEDSKKIIRCLCETFGDSIYISIMNQYTPMPQAAGDPLLGRPVSEKEYDEVVDFAIDIGVENGFIQEGGTVSDSFIPSFDGTGIRKIP